MRIFAFISLFLMLTSGNVFASYYETGCKREFKAFEMIEKKKSDVINYYGGILIFFEGCYVCTGGIFNVFQGRNCKMSYKKGY
ncbi:MAG: hypothetical protein AB7I27_17240 [Bacteriovoracaceae bacterium]